MAEDSTTDLDLDLEDLDERIETRNKVEERITKLSNKVKRTSEENTELKESNEELTTLNETITKERDFFSSFTDETATYPGANEFKDEIKEKFMAGTPVQDATKLVLIEKGKYEMQAVSEPDAEGAEGEAGESKPESPAGGSATASPTGDGEKPLEEISQEDKLAELKDRAEKGEF